MTRARSLSVPLTLTLTAAATLALAVAAPARAQFGGMSSSRGFFRQQIPASPRPPKAYGVKVTTVGGQEVAGTLGLSWVVLDCELGRYEIEPEKVKEVRLSPPTEPSRYVFGPGGNVSVPGSVVTSGGKEIKGEVLIGGSWKVKTDLGVLSLFPETLKLVAFTGEVRDEPAAKPEAARKK